VTPKRSPSPGSRIDARLAELVADTMFALSSPIRVQILGCLLEGPRAVGELVETLGIEQSAVSHQLRILREYTIVSAERVGRQRVYALYDEHVTDLIEGALRHVEQRQRKSAGKRLSRSRRAVPEG